MASLFCFPVVLARRSTTCMVFFDVFVTCASSPWYNLPTLPSMRTISPTTKRSTTSLLPTALASPGVAVVGVAATGVAVAGVAVTGVAIAGAVVAGVGDAGVAAAGAADAGATLGEWVPGTTLNVSYVAFLFLALCGKSCERHTRAA